MTGKTHRVGGMLCVLGGYTILEHKGMLLGNVNPLVQLMVMYPFAIYGSVISDLDHNWHSAPSKDIFSFIINKILHLSSGIRDRLNGKSIIGKFLAVFDANHRSWQTHSDLLFIIMILLFINIINSPVNNANDAIVRLILVGLILGAISHLFLDMLTPEGIWCISLYCFGRLFNINSITKVSLVPDKNFFKTGGTWENIVRNIMWVFCLILILRILVSLSPYAISFIKS